MVVKKRPVKKTTSIDLTKPHQSAVTAKERAGAALAKTQDSMKLAQDKIKTTKTVAAKAKAKERVSGWGAKVAQAKTKLIAANALVKQFEKEARELATMLLAKEKAIAAFATKWEKDYLKRLAARTRKQAQAAKQRARAKKTQKN